MRYVFLKRNRNILHFPNSRTDTFGPFSLIHSPQFLPVAYRRVLYPCEWIGIARNTKRLPQSRDASKAKSARTIRTP